MVLSGKGDGQRFASAIFLIWVLLVTLIWLYLLGIASIINGTFSLAERALTVVMGVTSVIGLVVSLAAVRKGPIWLSIVTFAIGIAVQAVALQISFGPAFATM
jgi:phosphoglycerol transferase MdoB-like AlkP superfamily enzyme